MSAGEIRELLDELERRCDARGLSVTVVIVGGAALALTYPEDSEVRATRDIDAVFAPTREVEEIVQEIARDRGLRTDWLNANARPWVPSSVALPEEGSGVRITVATAEDLIAMKMAAGRPQDYADLAILARNTGITSADELVDIAYRVFGEDAVQLPDGRASYLQQATDILGQ